MTIDAMKEGRAQVLGDGVTSRVDLDFQFVDEKNLMVVHTDADGVNTVWHYRQQPGNWSFTGGNFQKGAVEFEASALQSGERLTVILVSDYDQPYRLAGGEIDPTVIQRALDRTAVSMQAVASALSRVLVFPATLPGEQPNYELPDLPEGHGFIRKGDELISVPLDTSMIMGMVQRAIEAEINAAQSSFDANSAKNASQSNNQAALGHANAASAHADRAEAWAQGTTPGGPDTKSAKEWAEVSGQNAQGHARNIGVEPVGTLQSTTVQDALAELDSDLQSRVNALVNAAPGQLDTLKELSDALGGDADFAATITGQVAGKLGNAVETWHQSNDGVGRLYFSPNSTSYYRAGNGWHIFRNQNDGDLVSIGWDGTRPFFDLTGGTGDWGGAMRWLNLDKSKVLTELVQYQAHELRMNMLAGDGVWHHQFTFNNNGHLWSRGYGWLHDHFTRRGDHGWYDVGEYIFANNNSGGTVNVGQHVAGSSLRTASGGGHSVDHGAVPPGTYRCCGRKSGSNTSWGGAMEVTLWKRVG